MRIKARYAGRGDLKDVGRDAIALPWAGSPSSFLRSCWQPAYVCGVGTSRLSEPMHASFW